MRGTGDLKSRIVLMKRTASRVGGISRNDWEDIGEYPAEILHASARDFAAGGGGYAEEIVIAHIRQLTSVQLDSGLRFRFEDGLYDVTERITGKPKRGFIELRARRADMEGMGA